MVPSNHFAQLIEGRETAADENSTSFFPLLDRVAEGIFTEIDTEQALYGRFLRLLEDDGHISAPEAVASFKFALAIRSAAPRIEAHYQYYNTSVQPGMMAAQDAACPVWVHFNDKQYCSPFLERAQQDMPMDGLVDQLPFDRVLGDAVEGPPSILYADITHPLFGQFHMILYPCGRNRARLFLYSVRKVSLALWLAIIAEYRGKSADTLSSVPNRSSLDVTKLAVLRPRVESSEVVRGFKSAGPSSERSLSDISFCASSSFCPAFRSSITI